MTLVLVSLLGAVGCVVRYLMEYALRRHHPTIRPWATVAANTVGCLVAGYAAYRLIGAGDAHLRSIVITGFCGGLTTFSSAFAIPMILQREHRLVYSVTLMATTPLLCTGAFLLGTVLAR